MSVKQLEGVWVIGIGVDHQSMYIAILTNNVWKYIIVLLVEGKSKVVPKLLEFDNHFDLQEPHNFLINQFSIELKTYSST